MNDKQWAELNKRIDRAEGQLKLIIFELFIATVLLFWIWFNVAGKH